ncbi:MAG: gamma-glutamyltransferase [Sulfolobales archaeon]
MNKATYGRKGVSADHPLAVNAGIEVLKNGGNAFDAAIAVSAVLTVVHPFSGGIGGDGFLLALRGDEVIAYNGSGRSPGGFDPEAYIGSKPVRGPLTVTVPGLVEMWGYIYEEYCSKDLAELLKPAISLAENGYYADRMLANAVKKYRGELAGYERWARLYGDIDVGSYVRNRDLASTLRRISHRGWDEFYYGRLAEEIVEELEAQGVGISLEDLMDHEGEEVEILKLDLGSRVLYELPPNSQGISTLQMISAIYELELYRYSFTDSNRIRSWKDPVSIIYSFRDRYLGDPDYMEIDVSKYITYRSIATPATTPRIDGGDTTFFVIDDGENLVGFIQSLFYPFGSGLVAGGAVIQNRGRGFSYDKSLPNSPLPKKRPLHTLSILLIDDHESNSIYMIGCAGGDYRPQIHTRIYENIFIYNMDLGEALNTPRFIYTDLSKASKVVAEGVLGEASLGNDIEVIRAPQHGSTGIVNAAKRNRSKGFTEFAPDPRGASISIAV